MLFSPFERMVAARYLRARRGTGFISVIAFISLLGIVIGVATLIVAMAVMNGVRQEVLGSILGLNGHVSVFREGQAFTEYDAAAGRLRDISEVTSVSPLVEGQVLVIADGRAGGAVLRGMRRSDIEAMPILSRNIVAGSLDDFAGRDVIVIGSRMARKFAVGVGDTVSLVAPHFTATAIGMLPRTKAYRIVGLFEIGMYEYDANFIYMPLEAAQIFLKLRQAVSRLDVMLEDPEAIADIRRAMLQALGGGFRTLDWKRRNASIFGAIQVQRNVLFLILSLIVLVAAFNIVSSLFMLVKDKGRDIAILRTMGATRGTIMRIFFLSGASVGIIGTTAGFILGLTFTQNIETIRQWIQGLTGTELFAAEIYFLSRLPAVADPAEVAMVVLMGLGLSFLATLYPSWRAARIDPAEALRYE
ncbi:MAG: lipoprotein-releasing ABC transporter permease subunit [Proteobacteria bacterium]|nr:lipoprotein-releasing ABC transporter permease subunit [Pseudomonadota bacterium]